MDAANCSLACGLVSQSYINQGAAALSARRRLIKALLSNKKLQAEGWDEATIEMLLQDAALMDSNTFPGQVGLGEREGRVACPLVARRHGLLAHGIGRSGDITAEQPKAAGSSLLAKLCAALAADVLKLAGLQDQGPAVVLPCATGMTLTLVLLAAATAQGGAPPASQPPQQQPQQLPQPPPALAPAAPSSAAEAEEAGVPHPAAAGSGVGVGGGAAAHRPGAIAVIESVVPPKPTYLPHMPMAPGTSSCHQQQQQAQTSQQQQQQLQQQQQQQQQKRYVIWSRIDQKTCLKSISAANLTPVVIELLRQGDELVTDVGAIKAALERIGPGNVAAVVTTTSCFAPRAPDDVVSVAKLCAAYGVTHVVNNAYGVQSAAIMKALTTACRRGRVDVIVQSTDKNFMVPVGGAVITAPSGIGRGWLVDAVARGYPGRAAMTPLLDLLTTLLYWGVAGWKQQLQQREELYVYLRDKLSETAASLGERLLVTPSNPISLAMTLDGLAATDGSSSSRQAASAHGSTAAIDDSSTAAATNGSTAAATSGSNGSTGAQGGSKGSKQGHKPGVSFFGSMLWARNVSGTRVLTNGKQQTIAGITFQDYGCHTAGYPHPYLNAAAAIGSTKQEVDVFLLRLVKAYEEMKGKTNRA